MPRRRYVPPVQQKNEKSRPAGYASLDSTGVVPLDELPALGGGGPHATSHQNGGADEISVAGLSGLLADAQTALAHVHSAADVTTGTMATARLGSGTADATTFLRGDQTYAVPGGGGGAPTTVDYLVKTGDAGLSAERVVTDGTDITWDWSVGGQVKATFTSAMATDAEVAAAITAHEALGDPHPVYVTAAELAALDYIDTTEFNARDINTTAPLTGGGSLSADLTLAVSDATTTTKGVVELATNGESAANVVVQGNDARLSDARTPTAHATSHQNGGGDEISVAGLSGLLADGQTPLAHKTSHQSGGSDAIKLDDLSAPDDNTDLNASTSAHGLMMKYPGGTSNFLRSDGAFAAPTAALGLTTTEVSLGSTARRSGKAQITGLSGLTTGKPVVVHQGVGPYTGKGTRADETEMDLLTLAAKVLNTTTIDVYWASRYQVRGNYKLDFLVSA